MAMAQHSAPSEAFIAELAEINASLESAPASKVIEWAIEKYGCQVVLAASFQDVVLIDLCVAVDPTIEVVFLDTEAHFKETLDFVKDVSEHYNLNLTVTHPGPEAEEWPCGSAKCCSFRKVAPLREALSGKGAWLTSLKRADAKTRVDAPIVSYDEIFSLVKVNPLANWSDEDVNSYLRDHNLPIHPLMEKGYLSIGCAPTTRPVAEGEDPRAGRWADSEKTECGLHQN
jgi:phosphoadenosine phosphosulfate reductase